MTNDMEKIKQMIAFTKTYHILYVEDNDEAREQTLKMLQNFFLEIDTAVDGLDGVEKFRAYHDKNGKYYDLIISDVNMPNLDGFGMSSAIKKIHPDQEIIIVTAFNDEENIALAKKTDIAFYIHKPIELSALIEVISKASMAIEASQQEREVL